MEKSKMRRVVKRNGERQKEEEWDVIERDWDEKPGRVWEMEWCKKKGRKIEEPIRERSMGMNCGGERYNEMELMQKERLRHRKKGEGGENQKESGGKNWREARGGWVKCKGENENWPSWKKCERWSDVERREETGERQKKMNVDSKAERWRHTSSCARQNDVNAHVILPGAHRSARHMRRTFDTCFTLSLIYHLYVLFVWISYQARFGLKISYPAIVLNCGSFIVHILLLGTSKVFTLSVFLPCACVHDLLPGTQRHVKRGGGERWKISGKSRDGQKQGESSGKRRDEAKQNNRENAWRRENSWREWLKHTVELLIFRKFPEIRKFWKESQYFRKKKNAQYALRRRQQGYWLS